MNKGNPLTYAEAQEYLKELKGLLGPKLASQRIEALAVNTFNADKRFRWLSVARREGKSYIVLYIIELHRCGSLPVARGML